MDWTERLNKIIEYIESSLQLGHGVNIMGGYSPGKTAYSLVGAAFFLKGRDKRIPRAMPMTEGISHPRPML